MQSNISISRFLICILLAGIFIGHVTHWLPIPLLNRLDNIAYDFRLKLTTPNTIDPRIVILDIDDKSLAAEGHWPWPRNKLSELVDILFEHYQIRLLAFDITFPEKDTSSGLSVFKKLADNQLKNNYEFLATLEKIIPKLEYDQLFAQSLQNRNIVLGYYTDTQINPAQKETSLPTSIGDAQQYKFTDNFFTAKGYGGNLHILQKATKQGGYFNNPFVDQDGSYRRLPLLSVYDNQLYESLSFSILKNLFPDEDITFNALDYSDKVSSRLESVQIGSLNIPVNEKSTILVPYLGKQGSFKYISATEVLTFNVDKVDLNDKIVILGSTAAGILDLRSTPVQHIYPGVEIHANIVSGILDQRIKYQPSYLTGLQFIFIVTLSTIGIIFFPKYSAGKLSALFVSLIIIITVSNFYLWQKLHIAALLATPVIFVSLIFTTQMTFSYLLESYNKKFLSTLFGQYIPSELVDEMVKSNESFSMDAENKELTVLFSDVRGFTSISEKLEADELAKLINEILSPITKIIHKNNGTIDKYIGDAIMAFWGAPLENKNHAFKALTAALAITPTLEELNQEFKKKGWPDIKVGIGLNTGNMSVGNMGSEFRVAYTVLGDAVNLGARLEGLTKQYGVDLIVSEFTRNAAPEFQYKELDKVKVKGKLKPVTIYEPLALLNEITSSQKKALEQYNIALNAYRNQEWSLALQLFSKLKEQYPENLINQIYIDRTKIFQNSPPEKNWDGSFTHTTK